MKSTTPVLKRMSPLLLVTKLEQSIDFYTTKLDFAVDFRYEDFYAGLVKDSHSIHLKSGTQPKNDRKNNEDPEIIFSVENIELLYQEMLSKSIEIAQPLRGMPYGSEFYILDPDGNLLAFIESAES